MRSRLRKIAREAARIRISDNDKYLAGEKQREGKGARNQSDAGRHPSSPTKKEQDALNRKCRELLAQLRKNCPDLIPPKPLPAGRPGPKIPLDSKTAQALFHEAMRPVRGESLLWRQGESELVVEVSKVRLRVDDGLVLVTFPVSCDQAKRSLIHVPFALGNKERDAGLVVATESQPRGPVKIISIWGEALTAFAWQSFLQVVAVLAAESGVDMDGQGLIPIAISARKNALQLQTLARHEFDRVPPTVGLGKELTHRRPRK